MKLLVRRAIMVLVIAAVAAGLVYAFMPRPVPVDLAVVDRGSMRVTVDEEGQTRVHQRYIVSAPLAGRLERIVLREGDAVEAGRTILARIEPVEPELLDERAVAGAEARVLAAEAAVMRSESVIDRAEAALGFARREHARLRGAMEGAAATQHEVDAAANAERLAEQDLRSAESGREIARFELQQARSALLRARPPEAGVEPSAPFEIPAPISGRVLRRLQESSVVVQPGTPLLELGDPADLEIVIDVLSTDAVKIAPGAEVILERWGGEEELAGRVRLVEPGAFTKISALGVEEQRVNVIIDFSAPAEQRKALGDGYRVEGRIVIWQEADVVKAPSSALFRQQSDWAVFVIEGDRAVQRRVLIGRRNGLEAQVLDGLVPGERVVAHPGDQVRDGVRVKPR